MEYHRHLPERIPQNILSMPCIYAMIVPLLILDVFLEVYHRICFPLYRIPYVRRNEYIRIDRHRLSYLPWYDKINCTYCGYANGLLQYASETAGRTETYWCSVKHKDGANFHPTEHQKGFLPYGDERAFRKFIKKK